MTLPSSASHLSTPKSKRGSGRPFARPYQAYLFLAPGLLLYLVFVFYPIINTARYSLFDWTGFSEPVYIGLENYTELFADNDFWKSIGNNFFFVTFYTILPILLALFLTALLTRSKLRGMSIYRTGLFIPQVMSSVVVGIIWRWLLGPTGPINEFLRLIGLGGLVQPWLGSFTYAPIAVGLVGTWYEYGLCMVLFIAGAQSIDQELYDAARIFGANAWQEFRYVTLPSLRPQILVAFVLTFIAAMRVFDMVFVLTGGGPGKQTYVTSLLIYEEAFQRNRAGYASAIAVVVTIIIIVVSLTVNYVQSRDGSQEVDI